MKLATGQTIQLAFKMPITLAATKGNTVSRLPPLLVRCSHDRKAQLMKGANTSCSARPDTCHRTYNAHLIHLSAHSNTSAHAMHEKAGETAVHAHLIQGKFLQHCAGGGRLTRPYV